jgi:hypothetical protein
MLYDLLLSLGLLQKNKKKNREIGETGKKKKRLKNGIYFRCKG